jgi:uncharacterized protein (DUF2336 family)
MSFLGMVLGKKYPPKGDPARYEAQKEIAQKGDRKARLKLARDKNTNREILYYLAESDPDPDIRKAVIENKAMPVHVSTIVARDSDADVRLALAARLISLLPDVSQDEHSQMYAFTVQALGTLALDEVLRIRQALSGTLKDHAHTPPKVAAQLARDVERTVAEPILRFCAALPDEELLDILKLHPAGWTTEAIASRPSVSVEVAGAVINTGNRPAGKMLIENPGVQFNDAVLHKIIERARYFPEWQEPVAVHKSLPPAFALDLAEFVDSTIYDILIKRPDFDRKTTEKITAAFRRRIRYAEDEKLHKLTVSDRLLYLEKQGNLNEEVVSDALAMRDPAFVHAALAHMAKTDVKTVEKIFALKKSRPIVALSWQAGLSMRLAFQLQKELGQVQPADLLYPRDGTEYPLTPEEITFQLEFLGLKAA